jgi:succinate dehydrogenase/fumarate reductase flavoprotein subunit
MHLYHPEAEGAEVSYLVQAMSDEIVKGNGPPFYLDMTGIVSRFLFKNVFTRKTYGMIPLNLDRLEEAGVDVTASPQQWVAAIQTLRGGIHTDRHFASDLPGLFAAGTSQSLGPGLFNGWSTMRAMGSGELAGKAAALFLKDTEDVQPDREEIQAGILQALVPSHRSSGVSADRICRRLQEIMFPCTVSVRKSETTLTKALSELVSIRDNLLQALHAASPHELVKAHETRNMVLVAEMCLRASLERRESRSDHYRSDYPNKNNREWLKWIQVQKGPRGRMRLFRERIPLEAYPYQPEDKMEEEA